MAVGIHLRLLVQSKLTLLLYYYKLYQLKYNSLWLDKEVKNAYRWDAAHLIIKYTLNNVQ